MRNSLFVTDTCGALLLIVGSCSKESSAPTQPAPPVLARVTIEFRNICPAWSNVPIYDGSMLVGVLSMPGKITFDAGAGIHELRGCSPTGPHFMSVVVTEGQSLLLAIDSTVCPAGAPCQ